MNVERDDGTLAAEMLAVKTVMVHVLGRINQLDPVLAEAIHSGFEDAKEKSGKQRCRSIVGGMRLGAAASYNVTSDDLETMRQATR